MNNKERLQAPPIIAHFDETVYTEVQTDANNLGLGAVQMEWENGKDKVISYASHTLHIAETNYSATEEECLTVLWAISEFRAYIYGRPFHAFVLYMENCSWPPCNPWTAPPI